MLAARAYPGATRFRLEQIGVPRPGPGEVLVKVEASGLTRGLLSLWRARGRVRLLPATLGHEVAGTVAELGADVAGWREGDRVRVHPALTCRVCRYCQTDREPMCPSLAMIGHAIYGEGGMPLYERYHNGGLAEYVKVPASALDSLPPEVPFEVAAKLQEVSIAYHALRRAAPEMGSTMILTGATGAAGACAIRCAPLFGITRIVAVSRTRDALQRILPLEPGLVVGLALEELPAGWEEGDGLTRAIQEAAGAADVLVDFLPGATRVTAGAIAALARGGRAVLVGGNWDPLTLPYGLIRLNGYEIKGSNGAARHDATELIELVRGGRLDVAPLITHRFTLAQVNEAVDLIDARTGSPQLIAIRP